jgi:hypothetical protein
MIKEYCKRALCLVRIIHGFRYEKSTCQNIWGAHSFWLSFPRNREFITHF